jgi:hypothetical protein
MSDWSESPNVRKEVADAVAWGKKIERERIIALIESKDEWHYEFSDVSDVIALIKGE